MHDKNDTYSWYNTDSSNNGGSVGYADNYGAICYGYNASDPASYCNTQAYVARVNQAGWCGYHDWRMPTIKELENIVSRDRWGPAIDTDYFPNTDASNYWSASTVAYYSNRAWYVGFISGNSYRRDKSNDYHVRLVRSGQ